MTPEPRTWTLYEDEDRTYARQTRGPVPEFGELVQVVAVDDIVSDEAVERVAEELYHRHAPAALSEADDYTQGHMRRFARAVLAALLPSYGQKERD